MTLTESRLSALTCVDTLRHLRRQLASEFGRAIRERRYQDAAELGERLDLVDDEDEGQGQD